MKRLTLPALLLFSGVLAAFCLVVADALIRVGWPYFSAGRHVAGALWLYAGVGALLGLLAWGLIELEWASVGRHVSGKAVRYRALRPVFYGVAGALASADTARWTFSGEQVSKTPAATWGPIAFMGCAGLAAGVGSALILLAIRSIDKRRTWIWLTLVLVALAAGSGFAYIDLTQFVALYSRIHTILELTAALLFASAFALILYALLSYLPLVRRGIQVIGIALAVSLVAIIAVPRVRLFLDDSLSHVWLEEVYVGRMLRRVQIAEAFFNDPFHWRGLALSRIDRLDERFAVRVGETAPEWQQPLREPEQIRHGLSVLRGGKTGYNVIVYYVDTLRRDTAHDRRTMPNVVEFARNSLNFTRAYSTGSDTLRSLPALTGGNYDVLQTPPNDILRVARRANYESVLMSAKSAHEFISKLRPEFRFDESLQIEDYPREQQVWGYGAQRPTAGPIVDKAIEYISERKPEDKPFFLWLFNFDQHNWRELDSAYVSDAAKKYNVPDPEDPAFRYRAVASAIDAEFGRLVAALERRKLFDNTILLFVSDHGEALGRDGFWVHSVFLWESLIRVPLILRVPGLPARKIEDRVSLVDVAPTLARYMEPNPSMDGYHGEDLLGYVLRLQPKRRLPLLLVCASKDVLVRVGIIDPIKDWKLVLSLEAAMPQLYDLGAPDPDAVNLFEAHPSTSIGLLKTLARSPVFPRSADDFDVRDTKEQKAIAASESKPQAHQ